MWQSFIVLCALGEPTSFDTCWAMNSPFVVKTYEECVDLTLMKLQTLWLEVDYEAFELRNVQCINVIEGIEEVGERL